MKVVCYNIFMETKILYLNSSPYENGKKTGEYFKNFINEEILIYKELLKDTKIKEHCYRLSEKLKAQYPNYYDEILGKSVGAEVDFDAYFLMMCPELDKRNEHCTTITCKKSNGKFILSHNEDDNYVKDNFCISKVYTKTGWFATNDIYHMPFGNGFSWNSYGIIKTINYCHDPSPNIENLSRYFSQRHISEATSIEDLIKRCKELKPASGYHVNALDINNNIAVSIEVFSDGVNAQYIDDFYIHSNHFVRGKYSNNHVFDKDSNSSFRLDKANQLFKNIDEISLKNIYDILMFRSTEDKFENSIFQTENDPYLTGLNFSFDIDDKDHVYLSVFVNNEKLKLNYDL